jgi:hypothetical protein
VTAKAPDGWTPAFPSAQSLYNHRLPQGLVALSSGPNKYCVIAIVCSPGTTSHSAHLHLRHLPYRMRRRGPPRVVYYRGIPRGAPVIDYYRTMAEIRTIEPKTFGRRALQNDRHGVSCVSFLLLDYQAQTLSCTREDQGLVGACGSAIPEKRTKESQDPVQRLMPSLLTPRQLTRFSWPLNDPTLSPRRTSHT